MPMRQKTRLFLEGNYCQHFILALIILNAALLGIETIKTLPSVYIIWLTRLDHMILYVFIVELALKFYTYRAASLRQPWLMFDSFVVAIALLPMSDSFAVLRAFRVLRVLRLISGIRAMRRVIEGVLIAVPGILSVAALMMIFFYVFAVIGTDLFGEAFPAWFGTLGRTMYTLFQIMTLESWSMGIVRPVMQVYPYAWVFFVVYILVTAFTTLNLFIAIIVNAMNAHSDESAAKGRENLRQEIKDMEQRLLTEIRQGGIRSEQSPKQNE